MKFSIRFLICAATVGAIVLASSVSCNKSPSDSAEGTLSWRFSSHLHTRATVDLPDTDAFILLVKDSDGNVLYQGAYGSSPESIMVSPGSYSVRVVSREFEKPEFSAPQFGDEQVAVVTSGTSTKVELKCIQMNAGIRLRVGTEFSDSYPNGSLSVSSADGSLDFGNYESRTGFFKPGNVSLVLNNGTSTSTLLTRYLEACEILTLKVTCPSVTPPDPSEPSSGFSISIDTVRTWTSYEYEIGSDAGNPGSSASEAYSVSQAKEHSGEKEVWVCGYIVGGDLSSGKNGISFQTPFSSMSCMAIAARSSVSDKSSCISVQLPTGKIRTALNLVDHPELLGQKVYLKGDIVASYYGLTGIQNITEYSFTK